MADSGDLAPDTGQDGSGTVELASVLDLTAAAPLQSSLLAHRGQALEIDASKVERLGGLCLQVLVSAAATWRADEAQLKIISPSQGFEQALDHFGLSLDTLEAKDAA